MIRSGQVTDTGLGSMSAVPEQQTGVRCSFCGKNRGRVDRVAIIRR